jgi:hypothetical protein
MRVIITGGTGLIGRRLAAQLIAEKHEVVILTRNPQKAKNLPQGARLQAWDGQSAEGWGALVNGDTAVVNLAGQPILTFPFTEAHKAKVLESRLAAGRAVRQAIEAASDKPRVLIQSSAVGIYGDRKDDVLTEDVSAEDSWFGSVVSAWEDAADGAPTRIAKIRTGIVLDPAGGALQPLVLSTNFFGGVLGSGKQWMSWIHIDDECAAIRHLIANENAEGVYNLVAPNPVQNKEFVKTLAKVLGRMAIFPAPELALRVALGELAATLLDSQRVSAQKLLDLGFAFQYPTLEPALRNLLKK